MQIQFAKNMTEQELIDGCINKNINAQRELYERYAGKMLGICMRYMCDNDEAHDALQDGFIRTFDKIGSYAGRGTLESWMRRLFANVCLERIRKEKRMQKQSLDNDDEKIQIVDENVIDAAEQMSADELMDCVKSLPQPYRVVFNMYVIDGYSHEEIAKILGITNSTSRSNFFRARALLQEKIKKINNERR